MVLKPLTIELWEDGSDEDLEPYITETDCRCSNLHLTKEATRQLLEAFYEQDWRRKRMKERFSGEDQRGLHGLF